MGFLFFVSFTFGFVLCSAYFFLPRFTVHQNQNPPHNRTPCDNTALPTTTTTATVHCVCVFCVCLSLFSPHKHSLARSTTLHFPILHTLSLTSLFSCLLFIFLSLFCLPPKFLLSASPHLSLSGFVSLSLFSSVFHSLSLLVRSVPRHAMCHVPCGVVFCCFFCLSDWRVVSCGSLWSFFFFSLCFCLSLFPTPCFGCFPAPLHCACLSVCLCVCVFAYCVALRYQRCCQSYFFSQIAASSQPPVTGFLRVSLSPL